VDGGEPDHRQQDVPMHDGVLVEVKAIIVGPAGVGENVGSPQPPKIEQVPDSPALGRVEGGLEGDRDDRRHEAEMGLAPPRGEALRENDDEGRKQEEEEKDDEVGLAKRLEAKGEDSGIGR
jgi:hypothetical protein